MNKYQKALIESVDRHDKENYNLIKLLIDRATQKKNIQKYFNEAESWECADRFVLRNACPSCENKTIKKSKFCPYCGQAIDNSELDEMR